LIHIKHGTALALAFATVLYLELIVFTFVRLIFIRIRADLIAPVAVRKKGELGAFITPPVVSA
jgi:hypothetical protein